MGAVKQVVGSTLRDDGQGLETNFVADKSAAWFAEKYKRDGLGGGHVIKLGPGNDEAAKSALEVWPGGLHVGGGITPENAPEWLATGAEKVIVTSYLFEQNALCLDRVKAMADAAGPDHLVIDLSCRKVADGYRVATNRWQTVTDTRVDAETLASLADYCSEYLVHAADVEGKCRGIDEAVVRLLGEHAPIPCTYAGGAKTIGDLERVETLSRGTVDLTFGSALDIFGGTGVKYEECVGWNRARPKRR
jgi:phosphoribosylformimino-5-aminoimidazole carboxamide ribotide isomerase